MPKLLPYATEPWRIPIRRRHQPAEPSGPRGYQGFRACLRWEFGFSCAFCLLHEVDVSPHGTEGWGLMWIEHGVLRSETPERINDYENCFYSCRFCNEARGTKPAVGDGHRLLCPCQDAWRDHFALDGDEIRVRGESENAVYTNQAYDLNDPRKVRMRRARRRTLAERFAVVTEQPRLHDRLIELAVETGDPSWVDDAERLWNQFEDAFEDLMGFSPIPEDADASCTCGHTDHHSIPEVLDEQTIVW